MSIGLQSRVCAKQSIVVQEENIFTPLIKLKCCLRRPYLILIPIFVDVL